MTELTIVETGEVVETMTQVEAERITARIADKLDAIADNVEQVLPLIGEALTREAWKALDYPSPTAYVSDRFTGALTRLPDEVRRSVVTELAASGMSTRAIGPVVGVSHMTVARDLTGPVTPVTPAPRIPTATPARTFTDEPGTVQRITGMDGKTYSRPGPQESPKPKRRPLTDTAREVGLDLRKIAERIERMTGDDRFSTNKNEVAAHLRHHLAYAVEVLTDLDNAINN